MPRDYRSACREVNVMQCVSAAMFGIDVRRQAFVGTATAVALIVEGACFPVYLATSGNEAVLRATMVIASGHPRRPTVEFDTTVSDFDVEHMTTAATPGEIFNR